MSQLTPMDIHNKEFKRRGRNGYDRYEVDKFLDQIVDDYGDALDEVVDLKNEQVDLNNNLEDLRDKNNNLRQQLAQYQQREKEVNEAIVSAQKSASEIKSQAEKEAQKILASAKDQAKTDTKFEQQQKDTLSTDYDRLKAEVGQFRVHLQDLLNQEIKNLNDDEWQHALDKYFDSPRYYPEDGSEPIDDGDHYDLFADEVGDEENDSDDIGEPDHIDKEDLDALESSQEPDDEDSNSEPKPMTGDSPSHETIAVNQEKDKTKDSGPTIVFPDDYKDHK